MTISLTSRMSHVTAVQRIGLVISCLTCTALSQELRIAKIEKEIAIRAATLEQAEIKKNYDDVQAAVNELESTIAQLEQARENTIMAIQKADTDVELVVRIKQGQDEVCLIGLH